MELAIGHLCAEFHIDASGATGLRPLGEINELLTQAGAYGREFASAIDLLAPQFDRALQRREELFTDEEVGRLLASVDRLLQGKARS